MAGGVRRSAVPGHLRRRVLTFARRPCTRLPLGPGVEVEAEAEAEAEAASQHGRRAVQQALAATKAATVQ